MAARAAIQMQVTDRGPLRKVVGTAVAANLPAHIPQRIAERARASLGDLGVPVNILPQRVDCSRSGRWDFFCR